MYQLNRKNRFNIKIFKPKLIEYCTLLLGVFTNVKTIINNIMLPVMIKVVLKPIKPNKNKIKFFIIIFYNV